MFVDTSLQFGHFDHSMSEPFCSSSSSTSYPSTASDMSAGRTSANTTPASSPDRHISRSSSVKLQGGLSNMYTPYELGNNLYAMPETTEDMVTSFHYSTSFNGAPKMMVGQTGIDYGYDYSSPTSGSFIPNHGLPDLEVGLGTPNSCSSDIPEDFVDPSQTTFIEESFEGLQSPFCSSRMDFNLHFTPADEFDANFDYVDSPQNITTFSPYAESKHAPSTPSPCSSLRQSLHTPLASSAALHRAQRRLILGREMPEDRHERKSRRDVKHYGLSIRIEKVSTKACLYPGCKRTFKRQEHLKRHERTHSNKEWYPCELCPKSFNRTDNLKAHMKLHNKTETEKTKSSRTVYSERAAEILAKMAKRSKRGESASVVDDGDRPSSVKRDRTRSC